MQSEKTKKAVAYFGQFVISDSLCMYLRDAVI